MERENSFAGTNTPSRIVDSIILFIVRATVLALFEIAPSKYVALPFQHSCRDRLPHILIHESSVARKRKKKKKSYDCYKYLRGRKYRWSTVEEFTTGSLLACLKRTRNVTSLTRGPHLTNRPAIPSPSLSPFLSLLSLSFFLLHLSPFCCPTRYISPALSLPRQRGGILIHLPSLSISVSSPRSFLFLSLSSHALRPSFYNAPATSSPCIPRRERREEPSLFSKL